MQHNFDANLSWEIVTSQAVLDHLETGGYMKCMANTAEELSTVSNVSVHL